MKPIPVTVDPADTRRYFRLKSEARSKKIAERLEHAIKDADAIIQMIARNYRPNKIWQWGSLLHHENFSEISDIDIALEGEMSPETFFQLLNKADAMTPFNVDIVQLETIDALHACSIRDDGRLVYSRET
ncbi:MAG: nucleotidyltransferase domain-containing protein [Fibrobacterota bacterium]